MLQDGEEDARELSLEDGAFDRITTIHTLDPYKLTSEDYADLSEARAALFKFDDGTFTYGWQNRYFHWPFPMQFPPDCGGFLYLYKPAAYVPPPAYEIRFRVTNNPDPSSFASGHDLGLQGLPRGVPLMFGSYTNTVLRRLILADGLIPDADNVMDHIKYRQLNLLDRSIPYRQSLWARGQPFLMNLQDISTLLMPVYALSEPSPEGAMFRIEKMVGVPSPHYKEPVPISQLKGELAICCARRPARGLPAFIQAVLWLDLSTHATRGYCGFAF